MTNARWDYGSAVQFERCHLHLRSVVLPDGLLVHTGRGIFEAIGCILTQCWYQGRQQGPIGVAPQLQQTQNASDAASALTDEPSAMQLLRLWHLRRDRRRHPHGSCIQLQKFILSCRQGNRVKQRSIEQFDEATARPTCYPLSASGRPEAHLAGPLLYYSPSAAALSALPGSRWAWRMPKQMLANARLSETARATTDPLSAGAAIEQSATCHKSRVTENDSSKGALLTDKHQSLNSTPCMEASIH